MMNYPTKNACQGWLYCMSRFNFISKSEKLCAFRLDNVIKTYALGSAQCEVRRLNYRRSTTVFPSWAWRSNKHVPRSPRAGSFVSQLVRTFRQAGTFAPQRHTSLLGKRPQRRGTKREDCFPRLASRQRHYWSTIGSHTLLSRTVFSFIIFSITKLRFLCFICGRAVDEQ